MERVTRLIALAAALLALVPAVDAVAAARRLMPGVTYDRIERVVGGKRVVIHVITAPRPGGLYELAPVLSNGSVSGREPVTAMQSRLASTATVVGVNGDLYNNEHGFPTGIFMRHGVLQGRPTAQRSTLGIGLDGLLRIARVGFLGNWGLGDGPRERLNEFNRPPGRSSVGLFTRSWGEQTPAAKKAVDVVIGGLAAARPGADMPGEVVEVRRGGGTPIPKGGAVLQATGVDAARLEQLAAPGTPFVTRLTLKPWWQQVEDAIGGGPALVRGGRVALPTTEQFTSVQLLVRHPRTAVGQLKDGRIVLVAADGRSSRSHGLTMRQLADELVRIGVVTGMALDGGGGTTLAFDGELLNDPSDGSERAVSDALMVLYYGAYAPPAATAIVSPNGDGSAERQRLSYRIVRSSTVDVRLVGPKGGTLWRDSGAKQAGRYSLEPELAGRPEGTWRWLVTATDELGNRSEAERTFSVNNTLGFLELSGRKVRRGTEIDISFRLEHAATLRAEIEASSGTVVRTLLRGWHRKGEVALSWSGRTPAGRPVRVGTYRVSVHAVNELGRVALSEPVSVVRR